jgi:hypothetical protein
MPLRFIAVVLVLPGLVLVGTAVAMQEAPGNPKAQMNVQVDVVGRARAFPRYGESLIAEARTAVNANEYERAEKILVEYRDALKRMHEALRTTVPNPERKHNGFRQLQIHVRKSVRELGQLVAALPLDLRPPFEFLRKEIDKVDQMLIEDLFPRRPADEKPKGKP